MSDKEKLDWIAKILKTNPDALKSFEDAYKSVEEEITLPESIREDSDDNLPDCTEKMINRIAGELVNAAFGIEIKNPVTKEELFAISKKTRPQLTGTLYKRDIGTPSYHILVEQLMLYKETGDKMYYHMFRQGLDLLDLDPVVYEMLGRNKASMSYWLPEIEAAECLKGDFKIPNTKVVKVPLPILQLTRIAEEEINDTTKEIVNRWAEYVFSIKKDRTYFIKTGTYSPKFHFDKAVFKGDDKERLGERFLSVHREALSYASPLNNPCIYGMSTTNEWVVREYIEDKENNPCIYHGLPLRTEYRVFLDFDKKEILGIFPYWDADLMKKRFLNGFDSDTPDMKHDYVIYSMHEEKLMKRFEEHKTDVENRCIGLFDANLEGQWSLDIMQNGKDFYIIDMAPAQSSALVERIDRDKLRVSEENWLPDLSSISKKKDKGIEK